MAINLPSTMRAVMEIDKVATVVEVPLPELKDNEIRLKVILAALNPADWKYVAHLWGERGMILGVDVLGEVVEIGPNINPKVTHKIGDKVVGFVAGGFVFGIGAYSEYTKATADLTWKIPEGVSYENALTFGVGCLTSAQALFHPLKLALVAPPNKVSGSPWVFIHGGSTSVGSFAIQWAKLSGYKVVTTCSPRNTENVKALGADAVFDYNDPEVVAKVKEVTGDSLHHALDNISSEESQAISVNALGPGQGCVMVTLLPTDNARALRADVTLDGTHLNAALGIKWHIGQRWFSPSAEYKQPITDLMSGLLPQLIQEGTLKPQPYKVWPGGLDGVDGAMKHMQEGKVSFEKIMFRISD